MKKEIKTTAAIFPMPVLMISTFNEDGTVDVMNAAWGNYFKYGYGCSKSIWNTQDRWKYKC